MLLWGSSKNKGVLLIGSHNEDSLVIGGTEGGPLLLEAPIWLPCLFHVARSKALLGS